MGSREWVERSLGKAREESSGGGKGSVAEEELLSLKVWVDYVKKRVVLGEASSDFVDVLFSFLTLPLSTIVDLLSKNSEMGSIDNFYDSIQKLGDQHWRTEACSNMVLSSHNAAGKYCENLKLNLDGDANPRQFYYCNRDDCSSGSICYYSYFRSTRCQKCGELLNSVGLWIKPKTIEGDGAFIKENGATFIITDDFHVKPYSVAHYIDILKEYGIKDLFLMKERTLKFGREAFLNLLKKLLKEKGVLTEICFTDLSIQTTTDKMKMKNFKSKDNAQLETEKLQVTLIMNKTNNNVLCAELRDEFVNQLFSFLTFPLGSVLKLIGCSNSLGCMFNLYNSIQELKINCFKSEEAKSMLISPQLPHFFGYSKQILCIKEASPDVAEPSHDCIMCKMENKIIPCKTRCKHGVQRVCYEEVNPKLDRKNQNLDGGFVREAHVFMMTDDLHITPLSVFSLVRILKEHELNVDDVEKREMTIGRAEVYALLEAMLISKIALSDALLPYI